MIVKKQFSQGRLMLAICDTLLRGKKISDSKKILDLSSTFYNGEEMLPEDVIELLKKAYIINAVGKKTIGLLIDQKLIKKEECLQVKQTPYVLLVFENRKS